MSERAGVPVDDRPTATVVGLDEYRLCWCGHKRAWHKHCSEMFPAVCTYEVAPGEDYSICSCMGFEAPDA